MTENAPELVALTQVEVSLAAELVDARDHAPGELVAKSAAGVADFHIGHALTILVH